MTKRKTVLTDQEKTPRTCSRCGSTHREKYMFMKKSKYTGRKSWRCMGRSVCSSKARRNRATA